MIETDRLRLRKPTLEDVDAILEAHGDPEVMRYIGDGTAQDRAGVAAWIERALQRWDADGFGQLVVERRGDDRVLGRSGFLVWSSETWQTGTRAELGDAAIVEVGWILAREHWGHGYAPEAAAACRDHGFGVLGLERIHSLIAHGNDRSVRVAEKIGERYLRDVERGPGWTAQLFAVDRP